MASFYHLVETVKAINSRQKQERTQPPIRCTSALKNHLILPNNEVSLARICISTVGKKFDEMYNREEGGERET